MKDEELLKYAVEARKNAISPTNYYVGAAILTKDGEVFTGCNLGTEDALYNFCAEQTAIVKMLSEGKKEIEKVAIVGGKNESVSLTLPCGNCRQLLFDLAPELIVLCGNEIDGKLEYKSYTIKELLPNAYGME